MSDWQFIVFSAELFLIAAALWGPLLLSRKRLRKDWCA